jgi:hypothetical protein
MDKFETWKNSYEAAVEKITAYRSDEHEDVDGVAAFIDGCQKGALFQAYRSGVIDQVQYRARYDDLHGKDEAPKVHTQANTASPK